MSYVQFGKYFLLQHIASGGMAEVYKAMVQTREGEKKLVAIKRILPEYSSDDEFIAMLVDEAKIMVTLNQPNIVSLIEFGKVHHSYFIAFEYVDGVNIKELILAAKKSGVHIPIHLVAYIFREVCTGLAYAHSRRDEQGNNLNIVHRDISPTNILLGYEGQVKILDFGIAKAAGQKHMTQVGIIRGKSGYMSPEQARAQKGLDGRSDIFAAGIIMYEMLTLSRLFRSQEVAESLRMIREMEIAPPRTHNRNLPPELEEIVMRSLQRDLKLRYPNAAEMEAALTQFLRHQGLEERARGELCEYLQLLLPRGPTDVTEPQVKRRPGQSSVITDHGAVPITAAGEVPAAPLDFSGPEVERMFDDIGSARKGEFEHSLEDLFSEESITLIANKNYRDQLAFREPQPPALEDTVLTKRLRPYLWGGAALALLLILGGLWWGQQGELSLTVTSEPSGAKVTLNGQTMPGATPLYLKKGLSPGQAMLEITLEGYASIRQAIPLRQRESQRLHFALRPEEVQQKILIVDSTPAGAAVFINGRRQSQKTPAVLEDLEGLGPFEVRLELDGYEPLTSAVTFQAQQRSRRLERFLIPKAKAERAPAVIHMVRRDPASASAASSRANPARSAEKTGSFTVNSVPFSSVTVSAGERVFFRGSTPLLRLSLPAGEYNVEMKTRDGQSRNFKVTIEAGKERKNPTVYFDKVEEDLLLQ